MKTEKPIFIHIPKTGGTSINCVMQNTHWQTTPDYHYRHIIYETKKSNCGDIFQRENHLKYSDEFIFTMLRDPVDRLVSEYYFLRKHQEFMSLLEPCPASFDDFVKLPQTFNYMLKFLNGDRIYDQGEMSATRANEIIESMVALNVHVGIFEYFDLSLSYFKDVGGFQWPKEFEVKRATINRPHIKTISKATIETIRQNNALDFQLYNTFKDKLLSRACQLDKIKFKHKGDRLDHVLPYTTRFCILEIELKNNTFIDVNKKFLVTMNVYLHKTVKTGREYTKKWVKLFKQHVAYYYPNSPFAQKIKQVKRSNSIDEIIAIAHIIDEVSTTNALGFSVTEARMKFQMTDAMARVFEQDGLVNTRQPIW